MRHWQGQRQSASNLSLLYVFKQDILLGNFCSGILTPRSEWRSIFKNVDRQILRELLLPLKGIDLPPAGKNSRFFSRKIDRHDFDAMRHGRVRRDRVVFSPGVSE